MKKKHRISLCCIPQIIVIVLLVIAIAVLYTSLKNNPRILGATTDISTSRETFIPIGGGSAASSEWTDVGGAAVWVNSKLYGSLKKVTFEASLVVPQGNQTASVRLFNATDKHPVWYSEVALAASGPDLLISSPVVLDSGTKLYQVQVKTQLGGSVTVLQSRLHVISQ